MEKIKDILHELRCDIACIPRTEGNKEELKNATQTLQKAWELVKECDFLPCVSRSTLKQKIQDGLLDCGWTVVSSFEKDESWSKAISKLVKYLRKRGVNVTG